MASIRLHPRWYALADEMIKDSLCDDNVCGIHLRLEEDMLKHVGGGGETEAKKECGDKIAQHYREAVQKHFPLIPAQNEMRTLNKEPYLNTLNKAWVDGREVRAVLDLAFAIKLPMAVFIGFHSIALQRGSTFSYAIHHLAHSIRKTVFVDCFSDEYRRSL